jgi:transcriptional regulator with XRE-family HTH domain
MDNAKNPRNGAQERRHAAKPSAEAAHNPVRAAQSTPGGAQNPARTAESSDDVPEVGARRDFANELRAWRQERGLTQVALGTMINFTGSYISDIECCYRMPTLGLALACDRELRLPGTLERAFRRIALESFPGWFAPVIPYETSATRIHIWAVGCLPGLLQTPDYARAVFRAGRPHDLDDIIERDVTARMQRQEIFDREQPPFVWFIIDESVLHRVFGNKTLMAAQLDKLIEMSARPNIIIQIMPMMAVDCSGASGPLTVFDVPGSPQIGYTEGHKVGRLLDEADEVATLVMIFDHLRAAALSPQESGRLLAEKRSEYGE